MITFECPHCANVLKIDDEFAGHEGWCRVCKEMVVVPALDGKKFEDLSPTEKYFRLSRIFKYAAARADKYKGMLAKANEENEQLKLDLSQTEDLKARLGKLEKHRNAYDKVLEHIGGSFALNANITEGLRSQIDALDGKLAKLVGDAGQQRPNTDETASELRGVMAGLEESVAQATRNAERYDDFMHQTAGAIEELRDKSTTAQNAQVDQRFVDLDDSIEACALAIEEMKTQMQAQLQAFASIDANLSRLEGAASDTESQSARNAEAVLGQVKAIGARLDKVEKREQPELPDVRALAAEVVESRVGERTEELYARLDALKARIDEIEVSIQEQTNELTANMGWMVVEKSGEVEARINESIQQLRDAQGALGDGMIALSDGMAALPLQDIQETAAAAESRLGAMESALEQARRELAESAGTRAHELEAQIAGLQNALWAVESHLAALPAPGRLDLAVAGGERMAEFESTLKRLDEELAALKRQPDDARWDKVGSRLEAIDAAIEAQRHDQSKQAPETLAQVARLEKQIIEIEAALQCEQRELFETVMKKASGFESKLNEISAAEMPLERVGELVEHAVEARMKQQRAADAERHLKEAHDLTVKIGEVENVMRVVAEAVAARPELDTEQFAAFAGRIAELEAAWAGAPTIDTSGLEEETARLAERVAEAESAIAQLADQGAGGPPGAEAPAAEETSEAVAVFLEQLSALETRLAERVAEVESAIAQLTERNAAEPSEAEAVFLEQLSVVETRLAAIERELEESAQAAMTADEINRRVAQAVAQGVAQGVKASKTKEKAFAVPDWAREPTAQPLLLGQAMAPARAPEQALLLSAFLRFMGRSLE